MSAPPSPPASCVALALADEIVACPDLVERFVNHFWSTPTAMLIVYAPDWSETDLKASLDPLVARFDLDRRDAPELLPLAVSADAETERLLVERADFLYSRRQATGMLATLQRVDDSGLGGASAPRLGPAAEHARSATPRYYSQHGEDVVALEAFADLEAGFFVEIGCIDGRRFSNTLLFEERGWRGLCVEAHSGYMEDLRRNRPGSTVVHAAIADREAPEVDFFANARGSLSTLDASLEQEYAENYGPWFTGFEVQRVPMRTISGLLDEIDAPHVDVLSIDVEGCDVDALRGLDLRRHRPSLIIIEAVTQEERDEIDRILLPAGYLRGPVVTCNAFYFTDSSRLARIVSRRFEAEVVATRHPLDGGGDEVIALTVIT